MLAKSYLKKEASMPRRKREEPEMITIRLYVQDDPDDKAIWDYWLTQTADGKGQEWIKSLARADLERQGLLKDTNDDPTAED